MRRLAWVWVVALSACGPVVDVGPGSDAESGDPDEPTTSTTATTATTAGPSTTVVDTSDSVSVSISTTEDATTYDPDPVDGGVCVTRCETPVDCCAGDPTCPGMIGEYPYNYSCNDGACKFGECESDEQCTFGGVLEGYVCAEVDGFAGCWPSCDDDQDCEDQFLQGWVCVGGEGICQPGTCATDAECTNGTVCRGDPGRCIYPCEQPQNVCSGFGHCDPDTGQCVCDSDDECMDGYACRPPP